VSGRGATLSRDLTAAIAFCAVAVSGSVPLPVLVAFPVAFVLSYLGTRPLASRRTLSVLVLLAVAATLFGWSFFGSLDLVIAAVSFAVLVVSHRLLAEPSPATTRQVLLTSLLVLTGGAAIVGDVLFAAFVLGFIVSASWTMARLVLDGPRGERLAEDEERPARRQVLLGTVFIIGLGITFFVVFPRLSWSQSLRRASPGLGGVTGMSDVVRLGGGGGIKTNPRVVFRVALEPDPGSERLSSYWVGRHFTRFDGKAWSADAAQEPPAARVMLPLAGSRPRASLVNQEFEITSAYGSRTLVALDTPLAFLKARGVNVNGSMPSSLVRVPNDQVLATLESPELTYTATSLATPGVDQVAPTDDHRDLPPLDPRLRQLATEFKGSASNPGDIAARFERELMRRYTYTLDLPGDVDDPLADFLFVRRAGHCEDFATALAILLRLEGIPTRVTTGFVGGQRVGRKYHVRAGDAHAWTEAFVDGAWRRFDATPEDGRGASPPRWLALLSEGYDAVEAWWRQRVVDYSFQDQFEFVRNLVRPPRGLPRDEAPAPDEPARVDVKAVAGGVLALVAVGLLVVWRRRRVARHPARTFLEAIEARLAHAGIDPRREPVEELAHRLTAEHHPLGPPLLAATRRYLEARFGNRPLEPTERRALLAGLETRPAASRG
jgi:protein-glutamine gamma-glutamyltransferase